MLRYPRTVYNSRKATYTVKSILRSCLSSSKYDNLGYRENHFSSIGLQWRNGIYICFSKDKDVAKFRVRRMVGDSEERWKENC